MDILAEYRALNDAIGRIDAIQRDLTSSRDRLEREVETLLDGGWSGGAARAFSNGWTTWDDDAGDVLVALDTMRGLMAAVVADLEGTDGRVAADHRSLHSRLGGE